MSSPITLAIIGITCVISFLSFENRGLFERLKHAPYLEKRNNEYYRLLSSGFVHGSWAHLLINMYVLYEFGGTIEQRFNLDFEMMGNLFYVLFYVITIAAANISTFVKHQNHPGFGSIGASGAVSGIIFAYVLFYPLRGIGFIFIPGLNIPAIILGIGYLIYSAWASKKGRDHIDHDAHYYGALFGMLFCIALRPANFTEFLQQIMSVL